MYLKYILKTNFSLFIWLDFLKVILLLLKYNNLVLFAPLINMIFICIVRQLLQNAPAKLQYNSHLNLMKKLLMLECSMKKNDGKAAWFLNFFSKISS